MIRSVWTGVKIVVALTAVLALVLPLLAQPAPVAAQTGVTQQKTVTTDAQGNTVVTERTFLNGQLVKIEVTVTSPQGRVLSKTQERFVNGQLVQRETVTVNGATTTKVEQEFKVINGVLTEVEREVETIAIVNGERVQIKQEFELRNGVRSEERRVGKECRL